MYTSDVSDPKINADVKIQCRKIAPLGALNGQSLAQNRGQGSTPSFANSCLTRGMANDCANTLPSDDSAMKMGTTRVVKTLLPQTFSKNWAATTVLLSEMSALDMAANWGQSQQWVLSKAWEKETPSPDLHKRCWPAHKALSPPRSQSARPSATSWAHRAPPSTPIQSVSMPPPSTPRSLSPPDSHNSHSPTHYTNTAPATAPAHTPR